MALAQELPVTATKATADDTRLAVRIVYAAPSRCPNSAEFEAELHKRTAKARPAADSEPAHVFRVEIRTLANGSALGRIATEWNGERSGVRELRDKNCRHVVSALALTAALAIDPDAHLSLETEDAKTPPGGSEQPPATPATPPSASTTRKNAAGADDESDDDDPNSDPARDRLELESRVGLAAGAARILSPGVMPLLAPFGELAWVGPGLFSPSIRLSLNLANNSIDAARAANFSWVAGELELCPISIRWGANTNLRPCAAGTGGAILANGRTTPQRYGQTRAAWSAGISAHVSQRLSARFGVELFAALLVPQRSRTFVFANPSQEIARTPVASGELGLGAFAYLP